MTLISKIVRGGGTKYGLFVSILVNLGILFGGSSDAQTIGETVDAEPSSCILGVSEEPKPGYLGVNGPECKGSPYNCRIRALGLGNRIAGSTHVSSKGDLKPRIWKVEPGYPVRDGNGTVLLEETTKTLYRFNFGQVDMLAGRPHIFAMSTQNSSAGWYPLEALVDNAQTPTDERELFLDNAGLGIRPGGIDLPKLACFEIAESYDPNLPELKVVYDTTATHQKAGDYLPLKRKNGIASANLVYNTPGCSMGGTAINHFPAGTKFQRLHVLTDIGKPNISIRLWAKDASGRYRKYAGPMPFFYGYVTTASGERRAGWMAKDALVRSSGCH